MRLLSFHNKSRTGDLVSQLINYVGFLQGLVVPIRAKALILVGMFALMFCLNWRLALVALLAPWSRPCQVLGPVLDEIAAADPRSMKVNAAAPRVTTPIFTSPPASALKSKRGAQSQADGLCQGSRQFGQTLKIETYQSTKQANYENTQNPKYTKPNRFKNETFQQPDSNREPKPRLQSVPNGFSDVQIFDPAQLFTANLIRR